MYVYILHVENKTRLKPGTMYHVVLQRLELVARHVRYQMVKYIPPPMMVFLWPVRRINIHH